MRINKRYSNQMDGYKSITNLSSHSLSPSQMEVLSMGLKYIPTGCMDCKIRPLDTAFSRFRRQNRLNYFFGDAPTQELHPFSNL